jgi:hypothetical protein
VAASLARATVPFEPTIMPVSEAVTDKHQFNPPPDFDLILIFDPDF